MDESRYESGRSYGMIGLKKKRKIIPLTWLCLVLLLSGGCESREQVADMEEQGQTENIGEADRTEGTEEEETDYEQRLEQAIAVLEEYFSASGADTVLSDGLADFEDDVEPDLPDYIRIADTCYGEMGKDENSRQTIGVVLEFTREYPYETGDGVMAYGEKVICIFQEAKEDGYQCKYRNNRLLLDSGAYPRLGASIYIQDGFLIVSEDVGWRGFELSFGYGRGPLELFQVCEYEYDDTLAEAGTVVYYNFRTGTAEGYTTEEMHEKIPVDICFVKGFSVNELHPIAFEDTTYRVYRDMEYTCSVEEDYLLEAIENQVVLAEDTEIEGYEWVDEGKTCFRVRVRYQEPPEQLYQHKEDYFFFLKGESVSQVLYVDYPSKAEMYQDGFPDRYPMSACDFDAHLEDVTFDGNADLIISLGDSGLHGTPVACAYVYENGVYRYEPTFEDIPAYETDAEEKMYQRYYDENGDLQEIKVD